MSPLRTFAIALALVLGATGIAHAKGKHERDHESRAEKRIERLTETLGLSEAQQALLREQGEAAGPLHAQSMQLRGELRALLLFEGESDRTRELKKQLLDLDEKIYASQADFGKKLRANLSAEQLSQFKEIHAEKKERRQERREARREDRKERKHRERDD